VADQRLASDQRNMDRIVALHQAEDPRDQIVAAKIGEIAEPG
jgi:hypothetical protein